MIKIIRLMLLLVTLCNLALCAKYKCDTYAGMVDRCQCWIREQTDFYTRSVDSYRYAMARTQIAIDKVCQNFSFCTDGFARNDDNCPLARIFYFTPSCREACLKALVRELNESKYGVCLHGLQTNIKGKWYCDDAVVHKRNHKPYAYKHTDGWRM